MKNCSKCDDGICRMRKKPYKPRGAILIETVPSLPLGDYETITKEGVREYEASVLAVVKLKQCRIPRMDPIYLLSDDVSEPGTPVYFLVKSSELGKPGYSLHITKDSRELWAIGSSNSDLEAYDIPRIDGVAYKVIRWPSCSSMHSKEFAAIQKAILDA